MLSPGRSTKQHLQVWVLLHPLTSLFPSRLSGQLPFEDKDPQQVESKILVAKFDPSKLYPNVSQSASAFCKKMLSSYPWYGDSPTLAELLIPEKL